jgi:hypothetical protein
MLNKRKLYAINNIWLIDLKFNKYYNNFGSTIKWTIYIKHPDDQQYNHPKLIKQLFLEKIMS